MKHNFFLPILFLFLITGCIKKETINLNEKPPLQYPAPIKKPIIDSSKGSLYTRQGTSLFADKKDLQIGDILQINISETLTNDSRNTKQLAKSNNSALGGGLFTAAAGSSQGAQDRINRVNGNIGVGFNSNSNSNFDGSIRSSVDEEFQTIISVIITEIYQNGNYLIQGSKELLINGQKQAISLSGVIRPYDIDPDNTVASSQIANLKLLYKKAGEDAENLEKPWGSRILESMWPF